MAPKDTAAAVCSKLEEKGYRGAVVPIERVVQLKYEIEKRLSQKEIDAGLYERYLTYLKCDVASTLPGSRSIIVTAAPQPQRKATFYFNGQTHKGIFPPIYTGDTDKRVGDIIQSILAPSGYQIHAAALPLKLLAVRSGMATYGKNNIAYVDGMGSFLRFKAFLSDMPIGSSEWLEPQVMKECNKCRACVKSCPTGAVVPDRFLIHAERCITFFNESTDEFPEWLDPSWHNSLVGCMKCQLVCPVNKQFIEWVEEGEAFDEAETELILSGASLDRMPAETAHKLRRGYMADYLYVLPRNLRALLR